MPCEARPLLTVFRTSGACYAYDTNTGVIARVDAGIYAALQEAANLISDEQLGPTPTLSYCGTHSAIRAVRAIGVIQADLHFFAIS